MTRDLASSVVAITRASSGIGAAARAVTTDVRDPDQCRRLIEVAIEEFGRLDVLVANAGIGTYGSILDLGDAEVIAMLDTNIAGTVWAATSHDLSSAPAAGRIPSSDSPDRPGHVVARWRRTRPAQRCT